jgi:NAD(P)-dependent dehydrogenase (short-subunit alcohol dehydrogenase family)
MAKGALSGKSALITAGSGGISGGCARALARDGAALMLMARGRPALEERRAQLLKEIPEARIEIFTGDAFQPADVQGAMKATYAMQGCLDIVVAVAGGGAPGKPLVTLTEDELRGSLEKNVVSAFMAIKYAAPLMKRGGAIVCISSTAAKMNFPWLGAYCAAKAAVEALVKSAAEELGEIGIRVNAVRPGVIRAGNTGRTIFAVPEVVEMYRENVPLLRPGIPLGEPDDIGGAVRYLCGPEAPWVTGQSIAVDGGNELRRGPDLRDRIRDSMGREAFDAAVAARD